MSTTPQELVERALALSNADGAIVIAGESSTANLRFAGNTLTTNGVTRGRQLTVISTIGGETGVAAGVVSRSNVSIDAIEEVVRASEANARRGHSADDAGSLVAETDSGSDWSAPPGETSIDVFATAAPDLGEAFVAARSEGRDLFGFAEHVVTTSYLGSSTGLRLRHQQPTGRIEMTGKRSDDWTRSSWVGAATRDFRDVDVPALNTELTRRLGWAERRIELPAGRYETLLTPSCVADLMIYQYWSSAARDAHDGRSVFSRQGGGTRIGESLGSTSLQMWSDPSAPGLECEPYVVAYASGAAQSVFDNGLPIERTDWLRDGELRALLQTRYTAGLTDQPMTPGVDNLLFASDDAQRGLEEMIESSERALLVTCLWYIREVDPQTLLLTGLTRDGVYLVENGEVTAEVNNYRFNESPVDLLSRLAEVSLAEATLAREFGDYFTRTSMPAWRVGDFNMSSVSQAS